MELKVTELSRCLDKKLLIFGFEMIDIFAIVTTLTILNFVFGPFANKFYFVWLPTALLASIIWFGKRGKPENYLVHLIRFYFTPGYFSAFAEPSDAPIFPVKRRPLK